MMLHERLHDTQKECKLVCVWIYSITVKPN